MSSAAPQRSLSGGVGAGVAAAYRQAGRYAVNNDINPPIGSEFRGYRIDALIGQGGMGVVYRAHDLRLRRNVALKVMAPDLAHDAEFRARFERESQLAMSLEHPNVVPIHDAGEAEGRLYLVMRDVEGTDLRSLLLRERALAPVRTVAVVTQVAAALDAAHAKGLVHRDVKPSNVLLDAGEHAYLADFGLTRHFSEGSGAGGSRSLGTPAYLAPEQIEGGSVDGRADVYSLACLLFECLTGTAPFAGSSRLAVAWAHLEDEPPRASERSPGLPAAIDAVLARAMAKDPDHRYSSCGELADAARIALRVGAAARPQRRTLVLVAAGAALATIAAVAAIVAFGNGDSASAGGEPVVHANSVVRVDPRTNRIDAVLDVGRQPVAAAVAGKTAWVYNGDERTVSEIDAETNTVREATPVSTVPFYLENATGPVLTADRGGAWLIGFNLRTGKSLLTHLLPGSAQKVEHRLSGRPIGIATTEHDLWVLAYRGDRSVVLRLDPEDAAIRQTIRLPTPNGTSIGAGLGRVWVITQGGDRSNNPAVLYRIDPRTGTITGKRTIGDCAARPGFGFDSVWLCVCNPGSSMLRVDPATLRTELARNAIPAQEGMFSIGLGSVWWNDEANGSVVRFAPTTGERSATIYVTPNSSAATTAPVSTTSIAAGAGSVWVTVVDS